MSAVACRRCGRRIVRASTPGGRPFWFDPAPTAHGRWTLYTETWLDGSPVADEPVQLAAYVGRKDRQLDLFEPLPEGPPRWRLHAETCRKGAYDRSPERVTRQK